MNPYERAAAAFWNAQPHPLEPNLSIGDFATAVQLATKVKFGGHASPKEAHLFWEEFKQLQMGPQEFEHLVDRVAPVAFAYVNRPPTMLELAKLREAQPHEAHRYFSGLPDKHYPAMTAGEMVAALHAAHPHAQAFIGRPPLKLEAMQMHFGKERPDIYYARLAADRVAKDEPSPKLQGESGLQAPAGGGSGRGGVASAGRSAPNQ